MTGPGRRILSAIVTIVAIWAAVATSSPYNDVRSESLTGVVDVSAGQTERLVFDLSVGESLRDEDEPSFIFRFQRVGVGDSALTARFAGTENGERSADTLSCSCRGQIIVELEVDDTSGAGFETVSWSAGASVTTEEEPPVDARVDLELVEPTGLGIRVLASGSSQGPVTADAITVETSAEIAGQLWLQSSDPANPDATVRFDDGSAVRLPAMGAVTLGDHSSCSERICSLRYLISSAPPCEGSTFDWRVVTTSADPVTVRSDPVELSRADRTARSSGAVEVDPGQEQRWLVDVEVTGVDLRPMAPFVMAVLDGEPPSDADLTLSSTELPRWSTRNHGRPLAVEVAGSENSIRHTFEVRANVGRYADRSAMVQPSITVSVFWLDPDRASAGSPDLKVEITES